MNRRIAILSSIVVVVFAAAWARAQTAELEKTLVANERAVNEAVAKGDAAAFSQHVAKDAWSIDSTMGRMPVADFVKEMPEMVKDMKLTSWDITEPKLMPIDANNAVLTYKWVGSGTYKGEPIPSPVWASTVWSKRGGKWMAVFHQESLAIPAGK